MIAEIEISVIVATYNRGESLSATLACLLNQTLAAERYEVIVVDDGSSDDTAVRVASFATEHSSFNLRFERHTTNRRKPAACNTGIRMARGSLIVFTDDDIRPVPGWLEAHIGRHQRENREVAVTGLVLYPDAWERKSNWVRFANSNYRKNIVLGQRHVNTLPPNRFAGGNTSLPRATLIRVGMFDEHSMRAEDVELGCRLFEAGVPLLFEIDSLVYHYAEAIRSIEGTLRSFRRFYEFDREQMKAQYPWYFERDGHWFLEPPNPGHDNLKRIAIKRFVAIAACRSGQQLAVRVLKMTDAIAWLYWRPLHQYVLACEALDGIRASQIAHS